MSTSDQLFLNYTDCQSEAGLSCSGTELASYDSSAVPLDKGEANCAGSLSNELFVNPFHIDDLCVFDNDAWYNLLSHHSMGLAVDVLARAVRAAPTQVIERIAHNLDTEQRNSFWRAFVQPATPEEVACAQRQVLDRLFWELIYWRMPDEYEMLTENERLHPGIFQHLAPDLRGKTVLDVGAGSGRATLACLDAGAARVIAIEPSPGLRRILRRKLRDYAAGQYVVVARGRFAALPVAEQSVDVALSCSAFTALPEQGGEPGLAELLRVTRPGGKIFVLWPRAEDRAWLWEHGFHCVKLPTQQEMAIRFRTLTDAEHYARLFYGCKQAVLDYILEAQKPEIPFSIIGIDPPCEYCWREVPKQPHQQAQHLETLACH